MGVGPRQDRRRLSPPGPHAGPRGSLQQTNHTLPNGLFMKVRSSDG